MYAKDMGITLVSISHIIAADHKAIFDGPFLTIFSSEKSCWGRYQSVKGFTALSTPNPLTLQWKL
jgi:hypothetical protein